MKDPLIKLSKSRSGDFDRDPKKFLPLHEYLKLAEKIIVKTTKITPSEDYIAYVAYRMMVSDWRYREGKIDRIVFRYTSGRLASIQYINKMMSNLKKICLSLDYEVDDDGTKVVELVKKKNASEHNFLKSIVSDLVNKANLTEEEKLVLKLRFYKNYTMEDIANKLGISKQLVSMNLRKSVKKIKRANRIRSSESLSKFLLRTL